MAKNKAPMAITSRVRKLDAFTYAAQRNAPARTVVMEVMARRITFVHTPIRLRSPFLTTVIEYSPPLWARNGMNFFSFISLRILSKLASIVAVSGLINI